jgi:hypothetical protein
MPASLFCWLVPYSNASTGMSVKVYIYFISITELMKCLIKLPFSFLQFSSFNFQFSNENNKRDFHTQSKVPIIHILMYFLMHTKKQQQQREIVIHYFTPEKVLLSNPFSSPIYILFLFIFIFIFSSHFHPSLSFPSTM